MKIRLGFVANSSSSSFIAFITENNLEKAKAELHNIERDILDFAADNIGGNMLKVYIYEDEGYGTIEEFKKKKRIKDKSLNTREYSNNISNIQRAVKTFTNMFQHGSD